MRPFLFSAAVCAALVVIIAASGGILMFQLLQPHPVYTPHVNNIPELRGFFCFMVLASAGGGILVWLGARVLRRDGAHRLAAVETIVRGKL